MNQSIGPSEVDSYFHSEATGSMTPREPLDDDITFHKTLNANMSNYYHELPEAEKMKLEQTFRQLWDTNRGHFYSQCIYWNDEAMKRSNYMNLQNQEYMQQQAEAAAKLNDATNYLAAISLHHYNYQHPNGTLDPNGFALLQQQNWTQQQLQQQQIQQQLQNLNLNQNQQIPLQNQLNQPVQMPQQPVHVNINYNVPVSQNQIPNLPISAEQQVQFMAAAQNVLAQNNSNLSSGNGSPTESR